MAWSERLDRINGTKLDRRQLLHLTFLGLATAATLASIKPGGQTITTAQSDGITITEVPKDPIMEDFNFAYDKVFQVGIKNKFSVGNDGRNEQEIVFNAGIENTFKFDRGTSSSKFFEPLPGEYIEPRNISYRIFELTVTYGSNFVQRRFEIIDGYKPRVHQLLSTDAGVTQKIEELSPNDLIDLTKTLNTISEKLEELNPNRV